jgi:hypothetical protein
VSHSFLHIHLLDPVNTNSKLDQCKRCASGDFCADCLKNWFLDACNNESKMPPKCCSIIPLSTVANLLDSSQVDLYKAKYEEWSTPDRIYCPVPTCSTFIPQRLYIKIRQNPYSPCNIPGITSTFNQSQYMQNEAPKKDVKPHVACPTCGVSVCTKCRSFSHIGNCPGSDIDPVLEEQLKKWKIKRCPKCRTGVRRMYGCSHIECRCGAHFCWECLLPIGQCGVSFLLSYSFTRLPRLIRNHLVDSNIGLGVEQLRK